MSARIVSAAAPTDVIRAIAQNATPGCLREVMAFVPSWNGTDPAGSRTRQYHPFGRNPATYRAFTRRAPEA